MVEEQCKVLATLKCGCRLAKKCSAKCEIKAAGEAGLPFWGEGDSTDAALDIIKDKVVNFHNVMRARYHGKPRDCLNRPVVCDLKIFDRNLYVEALRRGQVVSRCHRRFTLEELAIADHLGV